MRDRNALVTRDTTGESQHPVPSRPNPARPALYIDRGDSHHIVTNATREPRNGVVSR